MLGLLGLFVCQDLLGFSSVTTSWAFLLGLLHLLGLLGFLHLLGLLGFCIC